MSALTSAAAWLTQRLTQHAPQLGVFLPAGFPSTGDDSAALRLFADRGAGVLEVGIPYHEPVFDGPLITAAYQQALRQGTGVLDALRTVNRVAATTEASVVVMAYWTSVRDWGPEHFARDLVSAGAAGAMIVDLPSDQTGPWLAAARAAGVHTPQLVSRQASDADLDRMTATATGWVYAPAADALTGYTGQLDIPALTTFTERLHAAGPTPVVTGIGISTPDKAAQVRSLVSGVVIGTPVVRPLLELGASRGLRAAADHVSAFAEALSPTHRTDLGTPVGIR
ncbi:MULTISPECIES: tryptophan synthase subunit alpha [Streptomyces]|uniref:tryptophan synthase subunit alpha n=1 Tax=Streptomyces TaxID=1883 RepID=UPI000E6860CA|nr:MULTISPECIES: tryptophan synthase subunit alpha [Streptomyces]MDX3065558.1 tryptophan synthase subunit alpha [Streptomyces sp. ND04-05B]MDX3519502.1 tryptophan synthase subunit alpha [Streptomyces scabiei]